jgi:transposase
MQDAFDVSLLAAGFIARRQNSGGSFGGFRFQAHEKGDANRSAHVERSFSYIENNFLAGRSFQDWEDANRQARQWCDQVNATFRNKLK